MDRFDGMHVADICHQLELLCYKKDSREEMEGFKIVLKNILMIINERNEKKKAKLQLVSKNLQKNTTGKFISYIEGREEK